MQWSSLTSALEPDWRSPRLWPGLHATFRVGFRGHDHGGCAASSAERHMAPPAGVTPYAPSPHWPSRDPEPLPDWHCGYGHDVSLNTMERQRPPRTPCFQVRLDTAVRVIMATPKGRVQRVVDYHELRIVVTLPSDMISGNVQAGGDLTGRISLARCACPGLGGVETRHPARLRRSRSASECRQGSTMPPLFVILLLSMILLGLGSRSAARADPNPNLGPALARGLPLRSG